MAYSMSMAEEKKPKRKVLLPEGWRRFTIVACVEKTSKKGNPMFVFTFHDIETGYDDDVFAIAEQGKRWFLKAILTAVECPAGKDGMYEWDIPMVLNKDIMGLVEHEENTYINREGNEVSGIQHRITDVKEAEVIKNDWMEEEKQ